MRLLLDTHVFLWFIVGDPRLPLASRQTIVDPANEAFLSVASVWECVIKSQLGKLHFPQPAEVFLPAQRVHHQIASLDIDEATIAQLALLPPLHRDPFDRIMIAQSVQHHLTMLTVDRDVLAYNLPNIVQA